ncbi:hypothetical protein HXX76_009615 [Chlamydomonas incerta]|uniref:Conserved oligomeric Golgi complex subunit 1 n=1 Tax=Chlamydomonas incerta TaxID=51695 RepID=A0A835VVP1_CHLIN|nr:hypothetical protein HXX76_009615 [Chlamydomonas incerta]|eukprot:KAG2431082.1 hypothetical protein HXX76_009615 [Chlamydomonas incerta]
MQQVVSHHHQHGPGAQAGAPGQTGHKLSEAQRGAEALFTTKTISEIREIEVRTRKDIEQKKVQLRNLVGDSYRDLIDSADKILSIANNATTILNNVRSIQDSFTGLAHNFTSSDLLLNEKRDSLTKHEELYAVGSRVKYLVDTPELIWGCLDAARHLDACRRYLRAEVVHDHLKAGFGPAALARFPLLRHHWPTVTKFKKQIVEAVQACLVGSSSTTSGSGNTSGGSSTTAAGGGAGSSSTAAGSSSTANNTGNTGQVADLLAALASLQGLDSAALLQAFLAARRTLLAQLVASADGGSAAAAAETLSAVAQAAQLTVAQVGELFLASAPPGAASAASAAGGGVASGVALAAAAAAAAVGGADATCLLQQRCREEEADYSELMFGGRTTGAGGQGAAAAAAAAPEAEAWRRTNRAVVERLAALSPGQVEHACVAWLRSVAEDFGGQAPRLLAGLTTAAALVEVEASVRTAIASWAHPGGFAAGAAGGSAAAGGGKPPLAGAKRPRAAGAAGGSGSLHGSASSGAVLATVGSAGGAAGHHHHHHGHHHHGHHHRHGHGHGPLDAPHLGSWEAVAEWVVGRPLNIWQELFHGPFVVRSRELIDAAFAAVARGLEGPLDAALAAAAEAPAEPAGCIITRVWPMEGWDGGAAAVAAATGVGLGGGGGAEAAAAAGAGEEGGKAAAAGSGGARAYRQQVAAMQRRFDDDLRAILQSALLLVGSSDASSWPHAIHSTPVSHSPSITSLSRAASEAGGGPAAAAAAATAAAAAAAGLGLLQPHHSGSHHGHHGHPRSSLHSLASIKRDMQGSRAAELEPFVQSKCMELVSAIANRLQSRLDALGAPREGPAGAAAAEQVVLLGRLATALATDSRCLPVVLGAPEGWKAAAAGLPSSISHAAHARTAGAGRAGAAGRGGAAGNARLAGVLDRLRGAAVVAYRAWAGWAAASLAAELRLLVLGDELLTCNITPLSWQETVIAGEADNALAEPVADMRFGLPASPSAAVLLLLNAACTELRRAGDHKIAPEALQAFEWELSRALISAYAQLLSPGLGALSTKGITEKGVLQLLFDVRFIRDVLVGGRPVSATRPGGAGGAGASAASVAAAAAAAATAGAALGGLGGMGGLGAGTAELADPAVVAALGERRREQAALEQMLQDLLDPIDWATYESYLWANVGRYFGRVSVLLGGLIQLQRAHPEGGPGGLGGKMAATGLQDSNPLNVLPVAPRFQYLPISAPTASLAAQQQQQQQHVAAAAAAAAAATGGGAAAGGAGLVPVASSGSLAGARFRASVGALNRAVSGSLVAVGDAADSYSFADLGSARGGLRGGGAGGVGGGAEATPSAAQVGSAASVGAAALSALQARLQGGSLGTFGSMLGDKAAEVTAMASAKFGDFGDYLPTSALGSAVGSAGGLFSSLTKNVVKK